MKWLWRLLCAHDWTNRREGPRNRAGSFRIWTCGKCGKEIRHAELVLPRRPPRWRSSDTDQQVIRGHWEHNTPLLTVDLRPPINEDR